jgi:hypothetical protein
MFLLIFAGFLFQYTIDMTHEFLIFCFSMGFW